MKEWLPPIVYSTLVPKRMERLVRAATTDHIQGGLGGHSPNTRSALVEVFKALTEDKKYGGFFKNPTKNSYEVILSPMDYRSMLEQGTRPHTYRVIGNVPDQLDRYFNWRYGEPIPKPVLNTQVVDPVPSLR